MIEFDLDGVDGGFGFATNGSNEASATATAPAPSAEELVEGGGVAAPVAAVNPVVSVAPVVATAAAPIQVVVEWKEPTPPDFEQLAKERFKRMRDEASDALIEANRREKDYADRLKEAKKDRKEALAELESILVAGPDVAGVKREWESAQEAARREWASQATKIGGAAGATATSAGDPSGAASNTGDARDDDSWKKVSIEELKLPEHLFEKLWAGGIETMEDWTNLQGEYVANKADLPRGIGKAKFGQVEEAWYAWIEERGRRLRGESEPPTNETKVEPETLPAAAPATPTATATSLPTPTVDLLDDI